VRAAFNGKAIAVTLAIISHSSPAALSNAEKCASIKLDALTLLTVKGKDIATCTTHPTEKQTISGHTDGFVVTFPVVLIGNC